MAKHALSLFLKIMLFSVVMLIVAKVIPYDGLVSSIIGLLISTAPVVLLVSYSVNPIQKCGNRYIFTSLF